MSDRLMVIVPGDPGQRTGGYLYDARIVDALRALGWSVEVIGLEGRFPDADETARRAMGRALAAAADGQAVVIDGLALGGAPEAVSAEARRLDLTALVHHPLADETGLSPALRERLLESEARALATCRRVIVTSPFTARRLGELGLDARRPAVVEPGVEPASLAGPVADRLAGREPGGRETLLCVASLTPRKGQDMLVQALAALADRDWHCVLVGSTRRDAEFAGRVGRAIDGAGLGARIECVGECGERALSAEYHRAGLCLLPSHYEGYGMVVSEALARGLPMITTTGGALADTAPADCCLRCAPGDVEGFRAALQSWFDDGGLRQRLTRAAVARRNGLRDWPAAGSAFSAALREAPA
ncbi:glycosyltransferase family 4 protein [Wenzhouxiangella sp. EGI_FJ10409]|uniref:glycosyltransferase family 4 protein n=1 Tax=Wenzhouxiangella sp. EGI_FJ10409 TaxID=3243767 RepID=UPI0035D90A7A